MNEELLEKLKKLIELMGFTDFSINYDGENKRFSVFITEGEAFKKNIPIFISSLDYLLKIITNKISGIGVFFIDINNYRREREDLLLELARAAARKAVATKEDVSLPIMNAYERRLIHLELSSRPDVKTESVGEGKERYIIVRRAA